jgi:hypothetical protein
MARYMVLIPDDEAAWEATSDEHKAAVYEKHGKFAELLAERGHKFLAGAQLHRSDTAHTVSGSYESPVITDGPYAESAEQLTGFYLIESDDADDLMRCVALLAEDEGRLEVRACVDR